MGVVTLPMRVRSSAKGGSSLIRCRCGCGADLAFQMSQSEIRALAETLGVVILGNPSEEQRRNFQRYLDAAKKGRCVENVIDFPLQRYNGRTLLHLAADNGLWEYLEELLKNGGTLVFLLSL